MSEQTKQPTTLAVELTKLTEEELVQKAEEVGVQIESFEGDDAEKREAIEYAIIEASKEKKTEEPGQIDATDAARKLAEENGIDLATLKGTGKDGKIGKPDVEKALASLAPPAPEKSKAQTELEAKALEVARSNQATEVYGVPRKSIEGHVDFFAGPGARGYATSQLHKEQTELLSFTFTTEDIKTK